MLSQFDPAALPYVVGSGVTLVVLLLYAASRVVAGRRERAPRYQFEQYAAPRDAGPSPSAIWSKRERSEADRRGAVRRRGVQVRVAVSSPALPGGADWGVVLDRSTGGMRLALAQPLPAGTPIQVRAAHAPDATPWSAMTVRHSVPAGGRHELGCEFDATPPWNILLLFG